MSSGLKVRRVRRGAQEVVVVRWGEAPDGRPSPFDVLLHEADFERVRAAVLAAATRPGTRYLAGAGTVLRVQQLLDGEVSLHWLDRPCSWASTFADELEALWPPRVQDLLEDDIPEYAQMSERVAPERLLGEVPCPCPVLNQRVTPQMGAPRGAIQPSRIANAGLAPAEEGPALDLAPQEIWRRLAGPFDARAVVAWGARLEVLGCERCGAHWAAAQLADGVRLRWTTRRICAELAARLVSAAGAQGMVGGDEPA